MNAPLVATDREAVLQREMQRIRDAGGTVSIPPLMRMDYVAAVNALYAAMGAEPPMPLSRVAWTDALVRVKLDVDAWVAAQEEEEGGWWEDYQLADASLPHSVVDFAGDRAWVDGTGAVALATILGTDETGGLESGWGETAFEPDFLGEHGYASIDAHPSPRDFAFVGAALTKILAGATIVATIRVATGSFSAFLIGNADASRFIVAGERSGAHATIYSYVGINKQINSCIVAGAAPGAINKLAITITSTRLEVSVNGSAVNSTTLDSSEYASMVCAGVSAPQAPGGYIVSYAIYDPVAIGDLPTVSTV